MLFTLNDLSSVGWIVSYVSQYPKRPRGNVVFYGEFLYTSRDFMSEFVSFAYLLDEMVTPKNL